MKTMMLWTWETDQVAGHLPNVAHVDPRTEDANQLIFIVVDIAFHDVHARAEQTFECFHIQN
jgi:hypothetical protein